MIGHKFKFIGSRKQKPLKFFIRTSTTENHKILLVVGGHVKVSPTLAVSCLISSDGLHNGGEERIRFPNKRV